MTIPSDSDAPVADLNPYAPPTAEDDEPKRGPQPVFRGKPRPWTVREVFGLARKCVSKEQWKLAGATLLVLGIPQAIAYLPRAFFELDSHGIPVGSVQAYLTAIVVAQVASFLATCALNAGATKLWLDVARGKPVRFGDLFGGVVRTPSMAAMMLIEMLAIGVGMLCFIVPGFIAIAGLAFAQFFVIDAKMGPIRALSASWEVTKSHRVALLGFWLAAMAVIVVGALACGIGVLIAYPLVYVAAAIIYLRLSGRGRKKKQ